MLGLESPVSATVCFTGIAQVQHHRTIQNVGSGTLS